MEGDGDALATGVGSGDSRAAEPGARLCATSHAAVEGDGDALATRVGSGDTRRAAEGSGDALTASVEPGR